MSKVIRDLLIPDHLKYNALYPLRIIGLNQDEKASGGMAGLTFLLVKNNGMDGKKVEYMPQTSGNYTQTHLYSCLQESGWYWQAFSESVRTNIVSVNKMSAYCVRANTTQSYMNFEGVSGTASSERLFFLSLPEIYRLPAFDGKGYALGPSKNEQYLAIAEQGLPFEAGWLRDVCFKSTGDGSLSRGCIGGDQYSQYSSFGYTPNFTYAAFCF